MAVRQTGSTKKANGARAGKQFTADPKNARKHTKVNDAFVKRSLTELGGGRSVLVDGTGKVVAGNTTYQQALALGMKITEVHTKANELVAVVRDDLKGDASTRMGLSDNRASEFGSWDKGVLAEIAAKQKAALAGIFSAKKEAALMAASSAETMADILHRLDLPDIPDPLYAADNEFGVPTLDVEYQAEQVTQPVERWGRFARHNVVMKGTWHFYTDDWRFNALWHDPSPVPLSGCVACIEPNVSTFGTMPRAVVLYGIYRKRWMARYWQEHGLNVIVDLYVGQEHFDIALLGVPVGWKAYATRVDSESGHLSAVFDLAAGRAQTSKILFVVYGGGRDVRKLCGERGWVWVPLESHAVAGRYEKEQEHG